MDKFYDVIIIHDVIKNVVAQQLYVIDVLNVPDGNYNRIFIKLFPKSKKDFS